MVYFDPQDVFVIRYLVTLPASAGPDFGIAEDKVEDLSQLNDGGEDEHE